MDWIKVARKADVPRGEGRMVIAEDELIAMFNNDNVLIEVPLPLFPSIAFLKNLLLET